MTEEEFEAIRARVEADKHGRYEVRSLLAELDAMRIAFRPILTLYTRNVEMTNCPYWVIRGNQRLDGVPDTGVFFSREEAEDYLARENHNLLRTAHAYCKSSRSESYAAMLRFAHARTAEPKGGPPC